MEGASEGVCGVMYIPVNYLAGPRVAWNVPESEGAYPTFPENSTEDQKEKKKSAFIKYEMGIETVEVVKDLPKGSFCRQSTNITLSNSNNMMKGLCFERAT